MGKGRLFGDKAKPRKSTYTEEKVSSLLWPRDRFCDRESQEIRFRQQTEPQEGDRAMGATANNCERGGTSPPERDRGELRGESQTHAVQGTRCRPVIRAEGLFRAFATGANPQRPYMFDSAF